MANLIIGLKKFLQNKNIVTIVGIVLSILILYFAYTMRVRSAINPVTIPYAKVQITSSTQITKSMIGTRQVPPSMLEGEVITNVGEVIDKYVAIDTVIPEGSLFYKKAVVEREQLPDDIILDYPEGYQLFYKEVDITSTYGNSIIPGNYVNIRLTATDPTTKKIVTGNLISNVRVLAVKDATGRAVFQNIDEKRVPAMVIFALPEEYFKMLMAAERMTMYNVNIEVVPTNDNLSDETEGITASDVLKAWINNHVQYMKQD